MTAPLRVAGLIPLTSIDFPGRLAAVVFLQGCPWRCAYCHNPHLLAGDAKVQVSWDEIRAFLRRRRGLLDGVVFSGGEPLLHAGLADAMREVRELGFQVGLHSAGVSPERMAGVLPCLDWIGLDIKAPWDGYDAVTGVRGSGAKARASLDQVLRSGVDHECRTTWHAALFPPDQLIAMAGELADAGVKHWCLQGCRTDGQPPRGSPPPLDQLDGRFDTIELRWC